MAHIYRLTFLVFLIFSGNANALLPKQTIYLMSAPNVGSFSSDSYSGVCASFVAAWSIMASPLSGFVKSSGSGSCIWGATGNANTWSHPITTQQPSCPANSTVSGSQCACNTGFEEKDGQCKASLSDLEKCAAWNKDFGSMPDSERPTDADGFRSVEPSRVCFRPYDDPFKPVNPLTPSPGKGCVMKFERDMAFGDGNGGWTSRGKYSTVTPEVCDWDKEKDGNDTPKEDACPAGYEKSKYADVCIPVEKNDTDCPEGYEPSQYVKGICIPKEKKPDPFDPDPTNPKGPGPYTPHPDGSCDPGYVRDGASCYKDPNPKQPDPTDPKQPGPGDSCPEGYSKNASGMCTKDTFTPGPGIPCPTGYSKNASGACVKDAPPACPPGEERNNEGLCVPKPCEPDPKWPEKCTACEKDALNPLVCKDDPGKCVPDPAIPDKCKGTGDGEEGSFGGTCEAGFTCKGDVIQCAIAKEQHIRACKLFDTKNAESQLYDKEKGKEGDQTKDLKGNENINMANRIDTSDAFGGGGSGVQDLNITVMGQSITLPFSKINSGLDALGRVLVAVSFLIALRIVGRG